MSEYMERCLEVLGSMDDLELTPGMTEAELSRAEHLVGARFPADLRELLGITLPRGPGWPDWRDPESVRSSLAWPVEGIVFGIEHNGFWYSGWGECPVDVQERVDVATAYLDDVPILIPVYSHRYIPAEPTPAGNPVLSVYGTDIIYYGSNLLSYLCAEADTERIHLHVVSGGRVRFWQDFVDEIWDPDAPCLVPDVPSESDGSVPRLPLWLRIFGWFSR